MTKIGDNERKTQNSVISFFRNKLKYVYIGTLYDKNNKNIIEEILYNNLIERGYSSKLAEGAIDILTKNTNNLQQGLYSANKSVYSLIKYGVKVRENIGESEKTVFLIDFECTTNNTFYIAEEVTILGCHTKRPDIVIYVNGIALAVIELKNSTVSVSNGIRQNITNQKTDFIENFFTTIQFCMAGNKSEGLKYGTILTPEKYYLEWKNDGFTMFVEERDGTDILIDNECNEIKDKLECQLFAMFYKKRFLDIIHNFVVFDKGNKKICRYNQYYSVKRTQNRIENKRKGGIVWHTQGSGKSLTMVWLSKWILSTNHKSRVIIITDREELDDQIQKTFNGVDENISRTKSGRDLINKLNSFDERLICSLVHKFGRNGEEITESDYDKYLVDLKESLPKNFSVKGDIFVFVDECHRTQSGKLHKAMKLILPNSIFIGFTGTPLLKKDKETSIELFGGYIHTYKFNEAVIDGVVLDLRYEARDIQQDISSQDKINTWFDVKTVGLSPRAKARLKSHWGNLQKVFSSRSRLEKIANDIIFDFETKARLMDGNGNALLVATSIYSACKYYEILHSKGFKKCAIISSYEPKAGDLRTDTVSDDEDTEVFEKYEIYNRMLNGSSSEDFVKESKRKFINEPANMKLLIVVDKLLTGFDAPTCTYIYIDKAMHDHGLFQAICRVNRLDGVSKDFGYIVDYKNLFGDLENAMNNYTKDAFESYDSEDVEGLIKNRITEAKKYLENTMEELFELCEGVCEPRREIDYFHYFCGENEKELAYDESFSVVRVKLYNLVSKLMRAYAEIKPIIYKINYSVFEANKIEEKVIFYVNLRESIGVHSGDFIDLKAYEPGMRYLIDNYISAEDSKKIGEFDDYTLLDFILAHVSKINNENDDKNNESASEIIENNIRKKIVEKIIINPKYYEKMSEVLEQLILDRKKGVIVYKQILAKYIELAKNVIHPENNMIYPEKIKSSRALQALYNNCGDDENLALLLHQAVKGTKMDGFRNNPVKENKIKRELNRILNNRDEVERIYKLIVEQEEY